MADRFYRDIELPNFALEKVVTPPDIGFIQLYGKNGFLVVSSNGNDEQILTGVGVQPWIRKTENYTAVTGDKIIADTSAGSFSITLPASPVTGDSVEFIDGADWFTNNLTVLRNGSTIEGTINDVVFNVKGISVSFVYDGTTWQVVATLGSKGVPGTGTSEQVIKSNFIGPVSVITGTSRYYPPTTISITKVYASVSITGSTNSTFDVKKNGVSILTSPLTVSGGSYRSANLSTTASLLSTDYLTVDITAAGTGAENAIVYIVYSQV